MPELHLLPSIRDSETISCPRCKTRQFPTSGNCVRCHSHLGVNYVSVELDSLQNPDSSVTKQELSSSIGNLLRSLRKRRGICQSQLAARTRDSISRTSLSKVENGRMLLPMYKLLPLAKALGLTAVILRFEVDKSSTAHPRSKR
jgi:ribosome-binding protein aMBF1 (putative translation factor)